jgi:hypothetical protein
MEGEYGLGEARDPGRGAAELAEESPGLEGGDGLFDQCPDLGVGPIDDLLSGGEAVPSAAVREMGRAACVLQRINEHLVRWACRKCKRLYRRPARVRALLAKAARQYPGLFVHWQLGLKPSG